MGCGGGEPEPQAPTTNTTPTVAATSPPVATPRPPAAPSLDERRKTAKAAYDAGDVAKAQTELEAIVAKEPNDVASQTMLGDVYASKSDKRAADAYLAASKADGGKDEKLALVAAHGLLAQKRWDDVLAVTQAATKVNDKSMPLWMYLGLAQSAKTDLAGAVATYQKLTGAFPDEPELWGDLAVAQVAAGDKDGGKKTARTALDKWTEVRSAKSTAEVKLGRGPDELCIIARALRRAGDPSGALAALGKFPVAKDELALGIDLERGFARHQLKDDKSAYQTADKVLKISNGSSPGAHVLLAAVALDQKKPEITKAQLLAFDSLGGDLAYAADRAAIEEASNKPADPAPAAKPAPKATPKK
ncbi:MAG: hypothetical protein NVSMB47_11690 [Polyangiales bacterium]